MYAHTPKEYKCPPDLFYFIPLLSTLNLAIGVLCTAVSQMKPVTPKIFLFQPGFGGWVIFTGDERNDVWLNPRRSFVGQPFHGCFAPTALQIAYTVQHLNKGMAYCSLLKRAHVKT